ncbi:MAG: DUF5723 family protein [Balneolales bacterium]|nr:DUF5723 family protein [Balneolales bacterium]
MALCFWLAAFAQPVLTPQNVALGGGGSTYITDYTANFYNPANLFISDRTRNIDIGFLITGTFFNGVQNFSDLNEQGNNIRDYISAFNPGAYTISVPERNSIVEDNYRRNRSTSLHQTRLDITLLGLKVRNDKRALSFAVRNRISSSFEVGRGWYSLETQEKNNEQILDRTLIHRYQSLYEASLGYSESFQFFTDMTPRLDEFVIGVAPKLVLGGAYQNARWKNRYVDRGDGSYTQIQELEYAASGNFGNATLDYLNGTPAEQALTTNITDDIFDIQGIGAGLDIGFTYLITLGSDLSTLSETEQRTQKSLRISFSITDIGFVSYSEDVVSSNMNTDSTIVASLPGLLSSEAFVGAPGQFLGFVDQYGQSNPILANPAEVGRENVLLPTAMHAGILFELNRIKLLGDLSIGLSNNAFNSTKLVASAGIELRPFRFLPIRAGTQLATELPSFFSFGTALETKYWDLSVATQFLSRTFTENPTLSGATVATLQFHF